MSDWHRETVEALGLPVYSLKNARHHWAVMRLRAGAPISVVRAQLGHSSPTLTLKVYGRSIPHAADRDRVDAQVVRDAKARKRAGNSANRSASRPYQLAKSIAGVGLEPTTPAL